MLFNGVLNWSELGSDSAGIHSELCEAVDGLWPELGSTSGGHDPELGSAAAGAGGPKDSGCLMGMS